MQRKSGKETRKNEIFENDSEEKFREESLPTNKKRNHA